MSAMRDYRTASTSCGSRYYQTKARKSKNYLQLVVRLETLKRTLPDQSRTDQAWDDLRRPQTFRMSKMTVRRQTVPL